MILLYWKIGREILLRQRQEGWGTKVITRLAKDLHQEFPSLQGFSRTNLLNMRAFADSTPDEEIVRAIYGKVPWGHNIRLMSLVKDSDQRLWYAQKTIESGWSRNILELQIESGLFIRQGNAVTNFEQTLPKPQSDLAQQLIKDPYSFSFLTLKENLPSVKQLEVELETLASEIINTEAIEEELLKKSPKKRLSRRRDRD